MSGLYLESFENNLKIRIRFLDISKYVFLRSNLLSKVINLNGGVPCLTDTDDALCFICKTEVEDLNHFAAN